MTVSVLHSHPGKSALEQAETTLADVRKRKEWENLRRLIYTRAMRMADDVVFDFRLLLTDVAAAHQAGKLFWEVIRPYAPQVLIGPGYGAMPLLYATAFAALQEGAVVNVLMVRDKRKGHHQKKWVEGQQTSGKARAVLVDDFMAGGSAVGTVEEALQADGHSVELLAVMVFFDMWNPLGSRQLSTAKLPILSLFKRHDVGLTRDCFDARPPLMKGDYPEFIERPLWWRQELNGRPEFPLKSSPVIADDAVFAADDQSRVWRHDAASGDIEWCSESREIPAKGIVQRLQYVNGSLVFGCYDGTVTSLDGASGKVNWRFKPGSYVHATPHVDAEGGRLFINTEQATDNRKYGTLCAMDLASGRTLWTYEHAYWPPGSPAFDPRSGTVVTTCNDLSIVAVDAKSGRVRWTNRSKGLVRGKAAIAHGRVFLACEDGELQCLDLLTGETHWSRRYGKGAAHLFVKVVGDVVVTLDGRWHLLASDCNTGEIRWLWRLRGAGNWCPVECGAYEAVLSRSGELAVFDPALELKVWETTLGGHYRQPPAFGRTSSGMLMALAGNSNGLKVFKVNPHYGS